MKLFRDNILFLIIFFLLLVLDIVVKNVSGEILYRVITKTSLIVLLLIFYLINNREVLKKKRYVIIIALLFFICGDLFFIFHENALYFGLGILFFILGKIAYALRFTNNQDFKFRELIPSLLVLFAYMTIIMFFIQDNLGDYFIPVLIYLFTSLIVSQFAYLRRNVVLRKSFWMVLTGVFFSIVSDSISVLQAFYDKDFGYHQITIMLFYGISQYLIVVGIVLEHNPELKKTKQE